MTGNLVFNPTDPVLLLDESLAPAVASSLASVGYNITSVETAFEKDGVKDPEIITWCRNQQAVWIHADDRAKRQHKVLLETSGIRTLWIFRKKGSMTGKEQLRIIAYVLPQLADKWQRSPGTRHYRASATNILSKPSLRPVIL